MEDKTDLFSGTELDLSEIQSLEEQGQKEKEQKALYEQQVIEQQKAADAKAEAEKPLTFGDYATEIPKALYLGARDTAASIITLPEQLIDLFTGEMAEEAKTEAGYQPEWDDWMEDKDDPLQTKTWWGGLIRGITHVGTTLAIPVGGWAGGAMKGTMKGVQVVQKASAISRLARIKAGALKITPKFKLLGKTKQITGATLAKGALSGVKFDALSITSLESNVGGMLRDKIGFIDTPLATKDLEHPMMKRFKNIAEGMFLGNVVDGVFDIVGTGAQYAVKSVDAKTGKTLFNKGGFSDVNQGQRADSVRDQTVEVGQQQKKNAGHGAYKNEPLNARHQANATSLESVEGASDALNRVNKEFGAEEGSAGSVLSNSEIFGIMRGSGEARDIIAKVLKRGVSENYFKAMDETAARQGIPKEEFYAKHAAFAKEVYEGRMTSDMTPEEFWKKVTNNRVISEGEYKYDFTHPAMAHTIDIVNGTLLGEIRSLGILGRELENLYDLRDVDGPAQQLVEKLIAGFKIRAIQKAETSQMLRDLDARIDPKTIDYKSRAKTIDEMVDARVQQSIDAFRIALKVAPEQGGDDLFKTIFEAVSMAKNVQNLDDLDNWMRIKLGGGEWKGSKKQMGVLMREFGSMFTHSVLSGPKTSVRAIMGTSTATFTRPMALVLGGAMKGNWRQARQGLASLNAMKESIPEAFELFRTRLNAYWSGELRGPNTRFFDVNKQNEQWNMYGHWAETRGNFTDKLVFRMANMARWANDNRFLTYSTKIMQSTDDAFGLIIGRARAREKAFLKATEDLPAGDFVNFDAAMFKRYEDEFQSQIFDTEGNLTDEMAKYMKKEATLTQDLDGFAKHLDNAFKEAPWARPFFLFARTGINGLNLTAKHTPGLNLLVKEFRDIQFTPLTADLSNLKKYGINNVADLQTAKAVGQGRMAMGGMIMSMASWMYLSGNLSGNGPTDRKKRQAWTDMGWKPRTIKLGRTWVSYDAFEPFNQILALVGDIGDHMDLMGEEWAEDNFMKLSMAIAGTITSKSYLAGMQQFVDLFSGKPGQQNRIIASLINNQLPLSSLRNEIGKVLNPYTKELGSDIFSSIANRNQFASSLPVKYDILTGKPIKDHNFMVRMFNMVSPVNFNLDYSPGRELIFNSGYDLKALSYTAPDGTDLSDAPEIRSLFQKAMGEQNLELIFNNLAKSRNIQISIAQMNYHNENGMKWRDPREYPHYKIIAREFDKAKKKAWASILNDPAVVKLRQLETEQKVKNVKTDREVYESIIGIRK